MVGKPSQIQQTVNLLRAKLYVQGTWEDETAQVPGNYFPIPRGEILAELTGVNAQAELTV